MDSLVRRLEQTEVLTLDGYRPQYNHPLRFPVAGSGGGTLVSRDADGVADVHLVERL